MSVWFGAVKTSLYMRFLTSAGSISRAGTVAVAMSSSRAAGRAAGRSLDS